MDETNQLSNPAQNDDNRFDFDFVDAIARIACYDDMLSAPHIEEVGPAPTGEFINNLSTKIHTMAAGIGGEMPYTVIREVAENFIHARFAEMVVSILDRGNTIRFADQGPGIHYKEKAQLPGFSSAIEPMKPYIRGVGSGFPLVKEYLEYSNGSITIEDNMGTGTVVTISSVRSAGDEESLDVVKGNESPFTHQQMQEQQNRFDVDFQPGPATAPFGGSQAANPAAGVFDPNQMPMQRQPMPAYGSQPQQFGMQPQMQQPGGFPTQNQQMTSWQYQQTGQPAPAPQGYGAAGYPHQQQNGAWNGAPVQMPPAFPQQQPINLNDKERSILAFLSSGAGVGVTELSNATGIPVSTTHAHLSKLEGAGLVAKSGSKRIITERGRQILSML